jgi:arsenate reductase (thioredoxin)
MKLSINSKSTESETKKKVLFVCVENAGRSQMAEGFFKKYCTGDYEPISAGTRHKSQIDPVAVEVMKEIGIDISCQKPKELTEDMMLNAAKIISMGCMDKNFCPTLFVPKVVDWGIEDPKDKPVEMVREIRDEIEKRIKEVVEQIGKDEKGN